jgi:hypothetical protein
MSAPTATSVRERIPHLTTALAVAAVALVAGAVVGGLAAGWPGAIGVAAGIALVTASYAASTVAIAWADWVDPRLVLPVGMGMYVTKFSLFGGMMIAIVGAGWRGAVPMAMGICAAVVTWTATQIWWTVHHHHPYVGPANPY